MYVSLFPIHQWGNPTRCQNLTARNSHRACRSCTHWRYLRWERHKMSTVCGDDETEDR